VSRGSVSCRMCGGSERHSASAHSSSQGLDIRIVRIFNCSSSVCNDDGVHRGTVAIGRNNSQMVCLRGQPIKWRFVGEMFQGGRYIGIHTIIATSIDARGAECELPRYESQLRQSSWSSPLLPHDMYRTVAAVQERDFQRTASKVLDKNDVEFTSSLSTILGIGHTPRLRRRSWFTHRRYDYVMV
jgi:hypothetical protein